MTNMTQPSGAEAQHIGTFWVMNFGLEQGTEPGRGQAPALGGGGAAALPPTLAPRMPVRIVPRIPAVFMRVVPEESYEELAQAMDPGDAELVLQRFARGCYCYAARVEGKLVAYGWVTFDEESIGELGLSFRLKSREAYIWDCATLPAFRGQRLYPALLTYMLGELYSAGMQRIWVGADADNLPSQSGLALAGFTPVVDILMTRDLATRKPSVRARLGVPEELVDDVRQALNLLS